MPKKNSRGGISPRKVVLADAEEDSLMSSGAEEGSDEEEAVSADRKFLKESIKNKDLKSLSLEVDAYGFLTYATVALIDKGMRSRHDLGNLRMAMTMAILLHLMNFFLQFSLLSIMYVFAIEPQEYFVETDKDYFYRLTEAVTDNIPLNITDPINAQMLIQCQNDKMVPTAQFLIVFLWTAKSGREVVDALLALRHIMAIPMTTGKELAEIKNAGNNEEVLVSKQTKGMKITLTFFCYGLRLFLAVGITLVGAKFLIYEKNVATLILKSLGLAFIGLIDEMLINAFLSAELKRRITNCKIQFLKEGDEEDGELGGWHLWQLTAVKLLAVITFTCGMILGWYPDIYRFRQMCAAYEMSFDMRPSPHLDWKNVSADWRSASVGVRIFGKDHSLVGFRHALGGGLGTPPAWR